MGSAMNMPARKGSPQGDVARQPGARSFMRIRSWLARPAGAIVSVILPLVVALFLVPGALAQPQTQTGGSAAVPITPMTPMTPMPGQVAGPVAQPSAGQAKLPPSARAAPVARKSEVGPTWQELTPAQQASLKPLAANWSGIGETQKRKWLAVSKNYPALPAPEQAKLHSRMTEWASLSQQQRAQARLNFAETKKLSPGDQSANWQAYQALSPEDKQKLAANASPAPAGAAAAVKPVAPQKLAAVPAARSDTKHATSGALGIHGNPAVDRNTLLPRPAFAEDPAVRKN
jgi:Protein of unknown function (DUF3106)